MTKNLMRRLIGGLSLAVPLASWAFPADPCAGGSAGCQTITLSGGDLSARAIFQTSGTNLTVTLSNVSPNDVLVPADVLTALFFNLRDVTGNQVALTTVSATTAAGADGVTYFNGAPVAGQGGGTNVGGEWAYSTLAAGNPTGFSQGVSSAGFGLFGDANFGGTNLQGPPGGAVDGLQYGILSAGDNLATGNSGGVGNDNLTKDSVVFQLTMGTSNVDLSKSGSLAAAFQYGTSLTEPRLPPSLPIPGTAALLLLGALMLPVASRMHRPRQA